MAPQRIPDLRPHISTPAASTPAASVSPASAPLSSETGLLGEPRPDRLALPAGLPASLGCDAVGTPREHGKRIMECLPRVGCVFADDERWWWIVPSGSHIGVTWPASTRYAVGALVGDPSWTRTKRRPRPVGPHLIHRPDGNSPYTPPIPLYFLTCRLAGSTPHWSLGAVN